MRNKKKELSIIKNLKNLLFLISPFWKYGKIYLLGMLFFSVILTPIKSTISILFTQTIIDAVGAGKTFNKEKNNFRYKCSKVRCSKCSICEACGMNCVFKNGECSRIKAIIENQIVDKTDSSKTMLERIENLL